MQPIRLKDFTNYRFLSGLKISPNEENAAFLVHQSNLQENGYDTAIWIYNTANNSTYQLTAGKDESKITWLDSENLLFSSQRGKKENNKTSLPETDFYKINLHGGEAKKAFSIPLSVLEIKPIADDKYIILADFNALAPDISELNEIEKAKKLEEFKENQDYLVMDELPFWRNGIGFTNKKRNRLYLFNSKNNKLEPLTSEIYQVNDWQLNQEKNKILLSGSKFEQIESLKPELALIDLLEANLHKITLIQEENYDFINFEFAENGYFFAATQQKRYGLNENPCFYFMNANTKNIVKVSDPDFSMGNSVGSDNRYGGGQSFMMAHGEAAFVITERACSRICTMTIDGNTKMISNAEGSVDCFDWKGEICLFIGMRGNGLGELYCLDTKTGEEKKLTHFNEDVLKNKSVVSPTFINFTNKDGVEIDGWVLEPVGYDDAKFYPAILDIHGGPKTAFGTLFFHEMQVWANMGYFVMFCNPRGSDGRGNKFADIRGRYGKEDYDDIMAFVDTVLEIYPQISQEKLGVTGGSYGGFMTNWIVGHTDRFAGAAAQRSISNWVSMAGAADIGYFFDTDQVAGDAWNNLEQVWEQSPLKYANKCTTPTLFIHSDEDYRCWQAEALQMFSALKLAGVPSRICMFKGENHELSRSGKPKHRIRRLQEITNWFEKWVR